MTRVAYVWADKMAKSSKIFKMLKSCFKKISLAAAFASDSSYDALQLTARVMACSVVARHNLWLHQWEGDAASLSKVVSIPFKGGKLFGQDLDPLLIESKDKRKFIPSDKGSPKAQNPVLLFSRIFQTPRTKPPIQAQIESQ